MPDIQPAALRRRVGAILASTNEVEPVTSYQAEA